MSMYDELKKGNRTLTDKVEKLEARVRELEEKNKEYENEKNILEGKNKILERRLKKYEELAPVKNTVSAVESNSFEALARVLSAFKID